MLFLFLFPLPLVTRFFICYYENSETVFIFFLTYRVKGVGTMTTIKRMISVFLITLLLLSGCAAPACTAEKAPAASTTAPTAAPTPESPVVTSLLRVIAADESGSTLLADISNRAVYRNRLPDGKAYPVGTLLEVTTTASVRSVVSHVASSTTTVRTIMIQWQIVSQRILTTASIAILISINQQ